MRSHLAQFRPPPTVTARDWVASADTVFDAWGRRDWFRFHGTYPDGLEAHTALRSRLFRNPGELVASWSPGLKRKLTAAAMSEKSTRAWPESRAFKLPLHHNDPSLQGARVLALGPKSQRDWVLENMCEYDVIAVVSALDYPVLFTNERIWSLTKIYYPNTRRAQLEPPVSLNVWDFIRTKSPQDANRICGREKSMKTRTGVARTGKTLLFNDLSPFLGISMLIDLISLGANRIDVRGFDFYTGILDAPVGRGTLQRRGYESTDSWSIRYHEPFSNFELAKRAFSTGKLSMEPEVEALLESSIDSYAETLQVRFGYTM